MKFIFAHPVYLQAIWVKLIYEDHRIKVFVHGWSCFRLEDIHSC